MIRIGIDAHGVGGNSLGCGNETYFYNLIKALLNIDSVNEYHFFVNDREALAPLAAIHPNARLVKLYPANQWLQRPLSAPLYSAVHGLDLVHFPFILPPMLTCRSVVTVHDICFEEFPHYYRFIDRTRMHFLVKGSCRRADRVFTVSEYAKKQICETYKVPSDKIAVTYNSGEHLLNFDTAEPANPLKDWPERFIFYVGLVQPRKNLPRLVKAFDRMASRSDLPHHLVIGGKWGWRNEELVTVLENATHKDRIHVMGYLPNATVRAAMKSADLFAFPSLFEGFGIPPMEAQSCGTPALVSDSTCFPEIYGNSVQYCDPASVDSIAEKMQQLLTDQALRHQLISEGARRLSHYKWETTAKTALKHYLDVAS